MIKEINWEDIPDIQSPIANVIDETIMNEMDEELKQQENKSKRNSIYLKAIDYEWLYVKILDAPCRCQNTNDLSYRYLIEVEDIRDGREKILECNGQLARAIQKIIIQDNNFLNYYIEIKKEEIDGKIWFTTYKDLNDSLSGWIDIDIK